MKTRQFVSSAITVVIFLWEIFYLVILPSKNSIMIYLSAL